MRFLTSSASVRRRVRRGSLFLGLAVAAGLLAAVDASRAAELLRIELQPSERLSLLPGASHAIRATAHFDDGSTADVSGRLAYTVNRPAVLSVEPSGRVQALAAGDADVTAVDPLSGLTARNKAKFKVAKLKAIALDPDMGALRIGETLALRAFGTYGDGTTEIDLTEVLEWRTNDPRIAVVSNEPGRRGIVTGVGGGLAKIRAVDPGSGRKSPKSSGQITVTRTLLSLSVDPPEHVLRVGGKARFRSIGRFEDAAVAEVNKKVDWRIEPPGVATIDKTGQVRAVAAGLASVRALDRQTGLSTGDFDGDGWLHVVGPLRDLAVVPDSSSLELGESFAFQAFGVFEGNAEPLPLTANLRWKSSLPSAISVIGGRVTCAKPGTATISVKDSRSGLWSTALGGDARVTCLGPERTVRVSPSSSVLAVGKGKDMRAFLVERDGTEREVTASSQWSSSDPSIVSIVNGGASHGRATAISPGVAIVAATDLGSGVSSAGPGGTSAKLSVAGTPESVTIFPRPSAGSSLVGSVGEQMQLKARVQYSGGATEGINAGVTWTSSDPTIVRIADGTGSLPAGRAELLRTGTVTVTITYPKIGAPPPANAPPHPLTDTVSLLVRAP